MEKYGQYRDRGSGIAPFFPIAPPASSPLLAPYHLFLFSLRLPFLIFAWTIWFLLVQWTPPGTILRKANLWCLIGIPGFWFMDIRVDGVQRGSLGKAVQKLPGPGSIIAASYTSPVDILHLAAIFDPIFTQSFPGSRKVAQLTLEAAVASCFTLEPSAVGAVDIAQITAKNPGRIVVVFPEATTSNGRGILRLTPSLLSAGPGTSIFPLSIRYTPSDIVTPIPGWVEALRCYWKMSSRQTHCIRTRIGLPFTLAQIQRDDAVRSSQGRQANGYDTNYFDSLQAKETTPEEQPSPSEQRALDLFAESLSRLGRAKTLALGVEEKIHFVHAWTGKVRTAKRKSL